MPKKRKAGNKRGSNPDGQLHKLAGHEKGSGLRFTALVKIINGYGLTFSEFFSEGFD